MFAQQSLLNRHIKAAKLAQAPKAVAASSCMVFEEDDSEPLKTGP